MSASLSIRIALTRRFGSGHQGVRACGGLYRQDLASPLLTYMAFKSRVQGLCLEAGRGGNVEREGQKANDVCRDAAFLPLGALSRTTTIGFFTIFDGDFEKYIQDFADKTSFAFDTIFPHIVGAPPTPVAKNARAFYQWALDNNYPPIGFYSAYPGLSVQDIQALLADRKSQPATTR